MTRLVACAVVRNDPPEVFAAEDVETLQWILALRLVASTPSTELSEGARDELRQALLNEQWGTAVEAWIRLRDVAVDVYPSMEFFTTADIEMAPAELQFMPLFKD